MQATYLATEFAGDPPDTVAHWYKLQAGTYARVTDENVNVFNTVELKVEPSIGTAIEFVDGDSSAEEIERIRAYWQQRS